MTRIAFIADPHLGNHRKWGTPTQGRCAPLNTRALDVANVLAAAVTEAATQSVTDLFILGDVFDTSAPTPQLVAEVQQALYHPAVKVHLIVGNHDQVSDLPGDHAMVSMDGWKGMSVYDKPTVVYLDRWQVHLVPYRPGRADDYLLDVLTELLEGADTPQLGVERVLGLHLGLRDADTPPWLKNAHDSCDPTNLPRHLYKFTLAGNWHSRKVVMDRVFQVGALVPTGFDNPGLTGYGSFIMLDPDKPRLPLVRELPGPRFVRVSGVAETKAALDRIQDDVSGWTVYLSVRCLPAERGIVEDLLDLYGSTHHEVLTDKAALEDAARSAATVAAYASTDSIQAAVTSYVDKMHIPEDISRAAVKALALDYIAGAAS